MAALYDQVFEDITVREDEWRWLDGRFPGRKPVRVLDIGCGNGALLLQLGERVESGVGVDASVGMIERARHRAAGMATLQFIHDRRPRTPLP